MTTDLKHIAAGQQESISGMSSVLLLKLFNFFVAASPTKRPAIGVETERSSTFVFLLMPPIRIIDFCGDVAIDVIAS